MVNNPIPIILALAVISRRGALPLPALGAPGTLELDAFLDNARTCINTLDKLSAVAHSGPAALGSLGSLTALTDGNHNSGSGGGLPDMKKIMEIVENLPL